MRGTNPDGTIDVRVVLSVRVDPEAWVLVAMDTDKPEDVLVGDIRRSVKTAVRDHVRGMADTVATHSPNQPFPVRRVLADGVYPKED